MKPKGAKNYTNNRNPNQMNWARSNPKMYLNMNIVDLFMMERRIITRTGKISYTLLADLMGIHRSSLYRITQGETMPNTQSLTRMCAVLGCQPGDILYMEYDFKDHSESEHTHEEVEHAKIESRPADAPIKGTVPTGQD